MTGSDVDGEPQFTFEGYAPDFFDFIVVDECHRGGARDESTWCGILEYFSPAVQLGMTATPKRDANVDTYAYFGEPVYTYALKEGIGDGFLTPFKLRQMASTLDTYRYADGDEVVSGEIDPEKEYSEADFNTKIVIDAREQSRVAEFMGQIDRRQKTLVFCATQAHAARVRDFINYLAATSYWSHDGRPITAQQFMQQLFGDLGTLVTSEDELRAVWSDPERRIAFIQRLAEMGYDADRLEDMQRHLFSPRASESPR